MSIHTYVYVTGPVKIMHVVKKLPTFLNFSILICNLLVLIKLLTLLVVERLV